MKNFFKAFIPAVAGTAAFSIAGITAFAEDAANEQAAAGGGMASMLIMLVLIFVLMYFLMIRPQKKKEKEAKNMQNNIQIGDEIVTIGGIVGLVVRKGDDNIVIETGGEKNKMRIKLWAVSENTSGNERLKAAREAAKAAKKGGSMSAGKLKDDENAK